MTMSQTMDTAVLVLDGKCPASKSIAASLVRTAKKKISATSLYFEKVCEAASISLNRNTVHFLPVASASRPLR